MSSQVIFCLIMSVSLANAVWNFNPGPCPDSHKTGDNWKPTQDQCKECRCYDSGYTCESCAGIPFRPLGCYIKTKPASLPYPECCQYDTFCPGDPMFNATEFQILGK